MILLIYLILLVAFIDTFAQLPIISPFAKELGSTPFLIGLAVGIFSATNILGNILAGVWSDKNGAKRVLYMGLLLSGIIMLLYVFISTPTQLIILRFLNGFTSGLVVPAAYTYLANHSKQQTKGKSMALSGAVVGFAAIIGPAFGGIMTATAGISWVFIIIGILMLITAIITMIALPQKDAKMSRRIDSKTTEKSAMHLIKNLPLLFAYLGAFALMFSQGVLAHMLPLKIEDLQYGSDVSGVLMSTFALTAILIFILPTNKLYDRFRHEYTLLAGLIILGFGVMLLSIMSELTWLYATMVVYGVGFALIFPSLNALIIQYTNQTERGKAFGIFYAIFSVAVVIGSFTIGALALSTSQSFLFSMSVIWTCSIILYVLIRRHHKIDEAKAN